MEDLKNRIQIQTQNATKKRKESNTKHSHIMYFSSSSSIKEILKLNETSQRSFVMYFLRTPRQLG